jgi:hypothetical protein
MFFHAKKLTESGILFEAYDFSLFSLIPLVLFFVHVIARVGAL